MVRHTSMYVVARVVVLGLTFVQTLVLIHFLAPSAFGEFSIVTILSSFVGLACLLLFRRGTLNRTFGRIGDVDDGDGDGDDAGDDDLDDDEAERRTLPASSRDPRAAFFTGFVLMTAAGAAFVALVVPLSGSLASLLGLPADTGAGWLVLGAASGVLLGQWQMLLMVPYLSRRPLAYLVISSLRAALVLGLILGLVIGAGNDAYEAVLGQFIGTAAAVVVALVVFRNVYRPAFRFSEVVPIIVLSLRRIPRHLGKWVIANGPALTLASAATPASVGYYRVASRLTMPLAFPTGAFFQAWLPMQKSPVVLAADQDEGRQRVRAMATTLLTVVVTGLLVVLLLAMDLLHHLVPTAYDGALELVPWLLGLAIADILAHTARRFARFPYRSRIYIWTLVTVAALTIPLSIVLVHALGAEGAALSGIIAWSALAAVLWACSQLGPAPIPLEYGRMGATVALGAACIAIGYGGRALWPSLGTGVDLVGIALFPVGLVVLKILPDTYREAIRGVLHRRRRPRVDDAVRVTIDRLEPVQRHALEVALQASPQDGSGARDESVDLSALAALRRCTGTRRRPAYVELALARYLFSGTDVLDRHHAVRELYGERVGPREIVLLERWRDQARKAIHG